MYLHMRALGQSESRQVRIRRVTSVQAPHQQCHILPAGACQLCGFAPPAGKVFLLLAEVPLCEETVRKPQIQSDANTLKHTLVPLEPSHAGTLADGQYAFCSNSTSVHFPAKITTGLGFNRGVSGRLGLQQGSVGLIKVRKANHLISVGLRSGDIILDAAWYGCPHGVDQAHHMIARLGLCLC